MIEPQPAAEESVEGKDAAWQKAISALQKLQNHSSNINQSSRLHNIRNPGQAMPFASAPPARWNMRPPNLFVHGAVWYPQMMQPHPPEMYAPPPSMPCGYGAEAPFGFSAMPMTMRSSWSAAGSSSLAMWKPTSNFQPPNKKAKYSPRPVELLPDSLLAKIFSYLSLKDRHQLCFVSRKWSNASRITWTDITFLNLNSVPRSMVNPILDLCPMIREIEANGQTIVLENKTTFSTSSNVRTIRLRNVTFAFKGLPDWQNAKGFRYNYSYFKRFPKLTELILHDVRGRPYDDAAVTQDLFVPPVFVAKATAMSLRRLVLINAELTNQLFESETAFVEMRNLECLYLEGGFCSTVRSSTFTLPRLRELCLVTDTFNAAAGVFRGKFPELEVLVYASSCKLDIRRAFELITASVAGRILVIAGKDELLEKTLRKRESQAFDRQRFAAQQLPPGQFYEIVSLPPRNLPPSTSVDGEASAPPLQIFVGGDFTKHVRFARPSSNVANFWRIDCPLQRYLGIAEVAEIFKDVWVAKFIRHPGGLLLPWEEAAAVRLFYSTAPLMFC